MLIDAVEGTRDSAPTGGAAKAGLLLKMGLLCCRRRALISVSGQGAGRTLVPMGAAEDATSLLSMRSFCDIGVTAGGFGIFGVMSDGGGENAGFD